MQTIGKSVFDLFGVWEIMGYNNSTLATKN